MKLYNQSTCLPRIYLFRLALYFQISSSVVKVIYFSGGKVYFDINGNTFDAPGAFDIINYLVSANSVFVASLHIFIHIFLSSIK